MDDFPKLADVVTKAEREYLREALQRADSINGAADIAGISRQYLHVLMVKHGIQVTKKLVVKWCDSIPAASPPGGKK